MDEEARNRARQEQAYCQAILAKSGSSVLLKVLPPQGVTTWKHYPEPEVYDHVSGAQWYYHCHEDSTALGEHGHFHCFVRPEGKESPACHLVAVGVDPHGRLTRLFTVNQWVVGGTWYGAEETNSLLERFNVELAEPDYLVNRWLTAVVTLYDAEIRTLNLERDRKLLSLGEDPEALRLDRSYEVLSELSLRA